MAARVILSSTFVRGFRTLAGCRAVDNGAGGNPGGLIGAVINQASATDMGQQIQPRAITYHSEEVNGTKIHFAKTGSGSNSVLLLPGALGSALTDFGPQLEGMNKDMFTLIAWDPRGYGRSKDSPRNWSDHFLERDAHDAAALMKKLGRDKYSLVGWSDGGITALIMAAKFPHRIRKCVSLAANSYLTKEEKDSYNKLADISQWSERMRKPFIDVYGEEKFQRLWSEWIEWFGKYSNKPEGDICKSMLKDIQCPVLVIQGDEDALVPMFHAEHIVKTVPNARLVQIPKGKHNLHLKFAKQFNSLVESFLLQPKTASEPQVRKIPEQIA